MFENFGLSGAVLVRPRCVWNASWVRLRASGARLGGVLGPSWGSSLNPEKIIKKRLREAKNEVKRGQERLSERSRVLLGAARWAKRGTREI